jgi:hypothetical protein
VSSQRAVAASENGAETRARDPGARSVRRLLKALGTKGGAMRGLWTRVGLAIASLSGCVWTPNNGQTFSGSVVNQPMPLQGYYNAANQPIEILALNHTTNSYDKLGPTVYTGTNPVYFNDPNPLYTWNASVNLATNSSSPYWQEGGVASLRARAVTGSSYQQLRAFDEDFGTCYNQNSTQSWENIGAICGTPYGTRDLINALSISKLPSAAMTQRSTSPYLLYGQTGSSSPGSATYYGTIGALATAPTLAAFQAQFGFNTPNADTARAIYYNYNDLGLGRDMSCTSFIDDVKQKSWACYVTNYALNFTPGGTINFDADYTQVLAQTIAGQSPIATVAMVYYAGHTTNPIQFFVYLHNGDPNPAHAALTDKAVLDRSANPNTTVPNNCMQCHGGSGSIDPTSGTVTGAHFLPFDTSAFAYSNVCNSTGSNCFTFANQIEQFRKLNAAVAQTPQTTAATTLLNGWYPPSGPQNAPQGTAATTNFIPPNWTDANNVPGSGKLYTEVVAHYCRTCHIAQTNGPLGHDWGAYSDFVNAAPNIQAQVCEANTMPVAVVTQDHFWNSAGRAHLISALGLTTPCNPVKQ